MARIVIGGSGAADLELAERVTQLLVHAGGIVVSVRGLGHGGAVYTIEVPERRVRLIRSEPAESKVTATAA